MMPAYCPHALHGRHREGAGCPFECGRQDADCAPDDCLGEIGCVTAIEEDRVHVKVQGRVWSAAVEGSVRPGQWVRVTGATGGRLQAVPLSVWLASCACA